MRKRSNHSIDYYIRPNRMMFSSIGMWPFDEEPSSRMIRFTRFRLIISVLSIVGIFVPGIMFVVVNRDDLKIVTQSGCVITSLAQILFKTVYLLARRKCTYRLYNELRSLWDTSNDPKERDVYEIFAYCARIGSIIFYLSVSSTALIYLNSGVFSYIIAMATGNSSGDIRHLPLESWYGMDITKSPIFEIAYIFQVVGIAIGVNAMCGVITTCGTIMLQISGQFRLITVWITNIGIEINREKDDYSDRCPHNFVASLTKCIRHHQRLIQLVDDVNDLLTPIIFLQLVTSGVEICLSGFALLNNPKRVDLLKSISYLMSIVIQFVLWCGPGEFLIYESQRISDSVYLNIPWYKLPPIYQRYLVLMIIRAQRYCSISTITFDELSLRTLTIIFNTAVSYFALLQQMQEKSVSEK